VANQSSKQYLSVEMESIGGRTVAFQIDEDGELMIAIDGDDAILSVESFQKLREWLTPETTADFDLIGAVKLAEEIIGRVCELPDRNSPDDEPDAMVCNASELEGCIVSVLENRWERATGRSVVKTGAEHG
jgi:hypothetical protein